MKKKDAFRIVEFIENHFDYVSQEEYFELCDMLLGMVVDSANSHGYAASLTGEFPHMFSMEVK